ncbi:MAG TPA: response regulator, partial [Nitrososphaeraceae archaeon]|nr:response regulator [Nitrososphaeraceae archaeon]
NHKRKSYNYYYYYYDECFILGHVYYLRHIGTYINFLCYHTCPVQLYGLYEVYTFNEPLKALANFKAHSYDLVITDIKMPTMNGCEFCQKIKEIDNDVKICFLTASEYYYCNNGNYEQREAECLLTKPIGIGELIKQMNSILQ